MNVITREPMSHVDGWEAESLIRTVLFRASTALDTHDWNSFLACCTAGFNYKITAYSPEIRREMTWFEQDLPGMAGVLGTIDKHNRDRTPIVRHWSTQQVTPSEEPGVFDVVSCLQVYRTELDGGVTALYAIGRYLDKICVRDGAAQFLTREVRLDTRMLGTGYHIPF